MSLREGQELAQQSNPAVYNIIMTNL